jgi:iron complex transport system substrate-binding protein
MPLFKNIVGLFSSASLFLLFFLALFFLCLSPGPKQPDKIDTGGRKVEDMSGRLVQMEKVNPETFILTPVLWHYLSVSPNDKPISKIPPYMLGEIHSSILGKLFPDLSKKPTAFTDFSGPSPISVEEVLKVDPDAVLVWNYMSFGLKEVNYHGLLEITGDGGDKRKLFKLLSGLTGEDERVQFLFDRFQTLMDKVLLQRGECLSPTKVAILGGTGYNLWGGKSQSFLFDNIKNICAINASDGTNSSSGVLNIENLLVINPDVLLLNPYVLAQTDMQVERIYSDERLKGLKAVKDRRVYHMPLGASRLEGPVEFPLSMLWLIKILHPEWNSQLSLRDMVKETYLAVYGYEMSDFEIDHWLRLDENQDSAFYAQFRKDSL